MIRLKIGHRGAPHVAPENTLKSFDAALDAGCNALELDVRACLQQDDSGDHLVVIHDATLDRTTDKKGRIRKLSLHQVKQANLGAHQSVPTLRETLEHLRGRVDVLFVEIKKAHTAHAIAQLLQQEIQAGNWAYEQLVSISFLPNAVRAVRELDPKLQIGCSLYDTVRSFRFNSRKEQASLQRISQLYNPQYFTPSIDDLTETMVAFAHAHHIKVATWTANTKDAVAYAQHCQADGIMSDYPQLLTHT